MKVLVTGAEGFIGKNLVVRLGELQDFEVIKVVRSDSEDVLRTQLANADAVIHLAGENRPKDPNYFNVGNAQLTDRICELLAELELKIPILFSSSTQAPLMLSSIFSDIFSPLRATTLVCWHTSCSALRIPSESLLFCALTEVTRDLSESHRNS